MKKLLVFSICCLFIFKAHGQCSSSLEEGLSAFFPMDNSPDDTVNGNAGTVFGAELTNDRFGNPNAAYNFDGIDDYIDYGDSIEYRFAGDYSISLWVYTDELPQGGSILNKRQQNSPFAQYSIIMDETNYDANLDIVDYVSFFQRVDNDVPNTSDKTINNSNANLTENWHQITISNLSDGRAYLFLDGELIDSSGFRNGSTEIIGFPLRIGGVISNNTPVVNGFFKGKIDDIRLYQRFLSVEEVSTLYQCESGEISGTCIPADCPGEEILLTDWVQEGDPENGDWQISSDGLTVTQFVNGLPTFLVSPEDIINTTIEGSFSVSSGGSFVDDDFIGFVFGYQNPEGGNFNEFEFLLFDWKRRAQGLAPEGFTLSQFSGEIEDEVLEDVFFAKIDHPALTVLDTDFSPNNGWAFNTSYNFKLEYFVNNIKIYIDDLLVFEVNGNFQPGKFGFYNYSQENVQYSSFSEEGSCFTFYADNDNDGFGDPNNTTEACSAPPNFVSNNNDCDDNNNTLPTNPGTTCDDGNPDTFNDVILSDGCTCQGEEAPPCTPYSTLTFTAQAQLDAFDCNCPIIEGDLVINGDDINDLSNLSCIKTVTGSVRIGNIFSIPSNDILQTLNGLGNIMTIGGDLVICNNPMLLNLDGLSSLMEVGGNIEVKNCQALEYIRFVSLTRVTGSCIYLNLFSLRYIGSSEFGVFGGFGLSFFGGGIRYENLPELVWITGFAGLTEIQGDLFFINVPKLESLVAYETIIRLVGCFHLIQTDQITDLNGLGNLEFIAEDIRIIDNDIISNVDDFSALNSVGGSVIISENDNLTNLNGFSNLSSITDSLVITNNLNLSDCCGIYELLVNNNIGGPIIINNNPAGCNSVEDIITTCEEPISGDLSISCVADITVIIPMGEFQTAVSWASPTIISDCQWGFTSGTDGPGNGGIFPLGTTEVREWVFDGCGEQAFCILNVTVEQENSFSILNFSCPSDMTVMIPQGQTQVAVNWTEPNNFSNCPNGFTAGQNGPVNGTFLSEGVTEVEYYIFDGCGNFENCTFTITVGMPLTINCPENFQVLAPQGMDSIIVTWEDPMVNSFCGGTTLVQTGGQPEGSLFPIGWTCIAYTAMDACEDETQCVFCFEVVDESSTSSNIIQLDGDNQIILLSEVVNSNQVKLLWYTNAIFQNGQYFVVERSENGEDFSQIKIIQDVTLSTDFIQYQFYDNNPVVGENYYRISVINPNNLSSVSNITSEKIEENTKFVVYPNPTNDDFFLNLSNLQGELCDIKISNTLGQVVFQSEIIANQEAYRIESDQFQNGLFIISVKPKKGQLMSKKLIIERL